MCVCVCGGVFCVGIYIYIYTLGVYHGIYEHTIHVYK